MNFYDDRKIIQEKLQAEKVGQSFIRQIHLMISNKRKWVNKKPHLKISQKINKLTQQRTTLTQYRNASKQEWLPVSLGGD